MDAFNVELKKAGSCPIIDAAVAWVKRSPIAMPVPSENEIRQIAS
jgi:hypothetical protein